MTAPAPAALPDMPEFVFAPARPRAAGGRRDVVLEMRRQPDGGLVLPVYSSVAGLVAALGRYQPWACFPLRRVLTTLGGGRLARILVDPPVELHAWRWTKASLAESREYRGRHAAPRLGASRESAR